MTAIVFASCLLFFGFRFCQYKNGIEDVAYEAKLHRISCINKNGLFLDSVHQLADRIEETAHKVTI